MENLNESVNTSKQRHGCVTAWLIFMIIANSAIAFLYLFASSFITETLPGNVSETMIMLLGIVSIANIIFAVMLFKWKKIGFWGFTGTSIIALIINLNIGLGIGQSLLGLISIAILFGILQIKRDGVSAWKNLE